MTRPIDTAPSASPFRASRAPMPIWRRARRCRMPQAIPKPDLRGRDRGGADPAIPIWCIIPVENSLIGRIADIHHLLPDSGLHIVGEHFLPIRHQLLGLKGATLDDIKSVYSQAPALAQCRTMLRETQAGGASTGTTRRARPSMSPNWATKASRPSPRALAAEFYGLEDSQSRCRGRASQRHALSDHVARRTSARPTSGKVVTTFVFQVKNVPAALYKAMGGFRHQWRQHDQAGKLSAGRLVQCHPILCRHPGPSRGAAM